MGDGKSTSEPKTGGAGLQGRRSALQERLARARARLAGDDRIPRRDPARPAPLSLAQERLWFLEQLLPGTGLFLLCRKQRLGGPLEVGRLARALAALVARHEVLRTTFPELESGPVQRVTPARPRIPAPLPVIDLRCLPEPARRREGRRLELREARRPMPVAQGPGDQGSGSQGSGSQASGLFRTLLLRAADEEHVLLLTVHHLVSDGWSFGVLQRELSELYASDAARRGESPEAPELDPLPVQYGDYAAWERQQQAETAKGDGGASHLDFWRRTLEGLTPLELPVDHPRPPARRLSGDEVPLRLPGRLVRSLESQARDSGASLFMALTAAWAAVLARWSGQTDLALGTPVAGRSRKEVEGLIGFFVNTVVLRCDLAGDPSLVELLRRAREVVLEAMSHAEVPFARVVQEVSPERGLSHAPLYQATVALQNVPAETLYLPAIEAGPLEVVPRGLTEQDLILALEPEGEQAKHSAETSGSKGTSLKDPGLTGAILFSAELFDRSTVRRWAGHLRRMLEALAYDPGQRLSEVELTGPTERQQLLWDWSHAGGSARAGEKSTGRETVLPAVLRWVESHPDLPAVFSDTDSSLTYGELEKRSGRWALWLVKDGLRERNRAEEPIVALCLERSVELVVAALAVLRSGGAYLPLDPAHPPERLAWMAEDAGAARVFVGREADEELIEAFRAAGVETVVAGAEPPAAADGGLGDGALPTPRAADAA
ncbi:MAG: condensation domain-containing protein, partial [Acidobacteriota bacterium]|nr:condensation domain-containing protein [Acidobacteriota bacterium]